MVLPGNDEAQTKDVDPKVASSLLCRADRMHARDHTTRNMNTLLYTRVCIRATMRSADVGHAAIRSKQRLKHT
eukprot:1003003-Rhodomonas_salina.3